MRTISAALQAEQEALSAVPHIHIVINSVDYSAKLLMLEHTEEAYRDRATLIFQNNDRTFDGVDLTGQKFRIGYGHYTGNNVVEPDGDNAGNEYSYAPDLWVKSQQIISSPGSVVCQLYCEGHWAYLREQKVMGYGTAPYYDYGFTATTIYGISESVIETAMSWTLNVLAASDSIIDVVQPNFDINESPYESAAELLYRLAWMTKQFLKVKANSIFEWVYPQESDAVDETYYSHQAHYFYEYTEKINLTLPNSIAVYANQDADGGWTGIITGLASDAAQITKYTEVLEPFIAGDITTQPNATARAAAILSKILAEQLGGRLIIPHDARVELYDKVQVEDDRGL